MSRFLPLLLLAAACTAPAGGGNGQRPEVLVSAAASLTNVLDTMARRYEAETGERIVLNVGASNALARQIRAGARVDLFISADEAQMHAVGDDIVAGSRVPLLSNTLVIAVPSDRPVRMASARELLAPGI